MANMGSTGTVNITHEMLENAVKAIEDYQTTINNLNGRLDTEVSNLIPNSFSGSAAQGFKAFYDNNIVPNVGANLTKMLDSIKGICDAVKAQIPGADQGVDDQLGQGNQNLGSAQN